MIAEVLEGTRVLDNVDETVVVALPLAGATVSEILRIVDD